MRRFLREVRVHVRNFFTNWHEYDAPVATKLRLTFRNRLHATFMRAVPPLGVTTDSCPSPQRIR
jgi:hypothetical protein